MEIKKRKIGFNYVVFDSDVNGFEPTVEVKKILNFAISLSRTRRKLDLTATKFCILESCELSEDETYHKIIFKSATHSYRSTLMDRETVNERENPKTLNEGETHKSHFLMKYKDGDVILLDEKFRDGLSVLQFIMYLNHCKNLYNTEMEESLEYRFFHEIIVKDNIDEELENLSRVQTTSIYVDKQLLGGEALNFSERLDTVQQSIVIDIKANRTQSIKETTKDILAKFNGGERSVTKIRIKGKSNANNDVTIDTSFIEKQEYVEAQINEDTGEVNSSYVLNQLLAIGQTL